MSLDAVSELYAATKLLAAAPRANCCRRGAYRYRTPTGVPLLQRLLYGRNIIRVYAEAPPPSQSAILRAGCAIAPPRNTRWLGSAPFTEIRWYAGLFRGPKNGLEIRSKSGLVNSFLNLGPKSGLVFGSEKRTQNWPQKTIKKRDQPYRKYCPILQVGRVARGKRPFQGASD